MIQHLEHDGQASVPAVSIVVAIYNVADQLEACIRSIVHQTEKNIEIILVDDGSKDASGEICDRFAREDSRVRVLHQSNAGVSVARNNGMSLATGAWIMFVDGDDWMEPDGVEVLLSAIAEDIDCDVVVGDHYWNFSDGERSAGQAVEAGTRRVLHLDCCRKEIVEYVALERWFPGLSEMECNLCAPWAKLYRRSFLEENGIQYVPNQRKSQDQVFNLYVVQHAGKLVAVNRPVYHYRIWDGSICQRVVVNQIPLEVIAFWTREVKRFFQTYGYDRSMYAYFTFQRARQMTMHWITGCMEQQLTWAEVRKNMEQLEAHGFAAELRNPYYNWKQQIVAVALKFKLYRLLCLIQKLTK